MEFPIFSISSFFPKKNFERFITLKKIYTKKNKKEKKKRRYTLRYKKIELDI